MSRPVFMSADHVERMNAILRDEPSVRAVCRDLDRRYALCYELNDGPEGRPVYWSVVFDPRQGVRMGLDKPEHADLTFVGDWGDAIRTAVAQRRGERHDPEMDVHGDHDILETVGAAYAAAQQVATIETTFPDVPAALAKGSAGTADAITHGRQSS